MEANEKTRVLIADELGLVREGIAELCRTSERYNVVHLCADGTSALQMMHVLWPDIAILDFHLPKLFSLEIVRKIRELDYPTRVLIMSSRADRKLVLESLRCGANGFVLKTGSARNLLKALEHIEKGGIYLSPELELDKVFISSRKKDPEDPLSSLSSREYQVFTMLVDGVRAKEIAARLDLSPKTVDTYRASLMRKLDIHDVPGLVKFAIQRDLTTVS
ncbi:MAG: response regulator transcription factor [Acidobacteria bacterium]|nr:response regulator transcription factor [Acidobacteriota bacterium]MBI3280112.1 response regulator transcription factor [Acidobacteriota bacterium]